MTSNKIKYFEEIDASNAEAHYEKKIQLNGKEIGLSIDFDSKVISEQLVEKLNWFINNLSSIEEKNQQHIKEDFEDGDTVEEYLEPHLDLLNGAEFKNRVDHNLWKQDPREQLLSLVYLKGIRLYPEDEEYFGVFDYTIGEDETDAIIVLFMKEDGEMWYMATES